MVNILIISHSLKIAEGTKELAEEMKQDEIDIQIAGGINNGELGTDADLIEQKLKSMDCQDGIVVLADLGSAVMSFNMVKEWLPEEKQNLIRLANAPLVEGAVLGAVEASLGKNLEEVIATIEEKSIINKNNL
ncbi:dihydroxyacetone kinase DhaM subunit [Halanaerobium saccharolyticum]|uniref:phosphoenolpyruvate--glycerone phosphotransferase n=1 Tax=Halanaerobium saccharolyticum TaxID=43595 RepID=A0A4R7YWS0_9FIRM|nr:dihydroxyacetone kinase phosphoryl donor subunit DhaM [Halanaerobium saccharolyticum]RAK07423.1 dihydroxyacetone kinase DhaM subunit [Halanaerobium saccharolyticum]TDW02388.1 dihydroxyacetone kinase DhaM subunit [Halanaerobium saccharolyticum]TDX59108.1 dihydroxyacetone kinase DhaM subunit [Halanaerobium saccharolyticum]